MTDCPVCLIEHDPATHWATLRVHAWFRKKVLLSITKPTTQKPFKPPLPLSVGWSQTTAGLKKAKPGKSVSAEIVSEITGA